MTYVRIVRIVHASVVCAVGIIAALCAGSYLRCVRAQWVSLHLVRVRGSLIQPCSSILLYNNASTDTIHNWDAAVQWLERI